MSSFRRGDKIRRKNGFNFSNGKKVATVGKIERNNVWFQETGTYLNCRDIEKVEEDMEKKYRVECDLSLEDIVKLRILLCNVTVKGIDYCHLGDILKGAGVEGYYNVSWVATEKGWLSIEPHHIEKFARDIVSNSKRKVVTVGDKKYYEDELQTALSNIKPI